ncbi:MAG: hypothetical protein WKF84_08045 [Pyrinomonadaceae bacterium]
MKICQKCGERFGDTQGFCPRDGEVLVKDNIGLVGRTLDNQYEIEKFIAAGGMGAVYRARHILLGDPVAIKILSPEMSGNAEWLKRFQREGQVAQVSPPQCGACSRPAYIKRRTCVHGDGVC